jgi:hypothetical protein
MVAVFVSPYWTVNLEKRPPRLMSPRVSEEFTAALSEPLYRNVPPLSVKFDASPMRSLRLLPSPVLLMMNEPPFRWTSAEASVPAAPPSSRVPPFSVVVPV